MEVIIYQASQMDFKSGAILIVGAIIISLIAKNLEYKLKEAEREREVFRKSVMERRKTDTVWIEGDSVMYGGR